MSTRKTFPLSQANFARVTFLLLTCFSFSKGLIPPGYMLHLSSEGRYLVVCTADGINKVAVDYFDEDLPQSHQSDLCSLSASNAAASIDSQQNLLDLNGTPDYQESYYFDHYTSYSALAFRARAPPLHAPAA